MSEVIYWVGIYTDILGMEEKVLARVKELMATQPPRARREIELTNVPVIRAQVKRFRERLSYWEERYATLDGAPDAPPTDGRDDGHDGAGRKGPGRPA